MDSMMNQIVLNAELNADLLEASLQGNSALISELIEKGVEINAKTEEGKTPLIIAAQLGQIQAVNVLLTNPHILVNVADQYGMTALMYAAEYGHDVVVESLLEVEELDLQAEDIEENTAIELASTAGHENIVALLEERGERVRQRVNGAQSAHEISVHASVSSSALNLSKQYAFSEKKITSKINELSDWLNKVLKRKIKMPREYQSRWCEPAIRCVKRLRKIDYIDSRSNVSMTTVLALVWAGINNTEVEEEQVSLIKVQELIMNRRTSFIKHLYEIQRGYNLSDGANPVDNGKEDEVTCIPGSFNKLIAALNEVGHEGVEIIFVTSSLINLQVPYITKQAFGTLSEGDRKRFSQNWNDEDSDDIQEECFELLKELVLKKLHEQYDEFSAEVNNFNQVIADAAESSKYVDMDEVMKQEGERQAAVATLSNPSNALIFRGRLAHEVEATQAFIALLRRNPERSSRYLGSYKV